jgi:hypothetical protein
MKLLRLPMALALLATPVPAFWVQPARAQMPSINMMPDVPSKTPEQKEAEQERDKAYKESLRKIPDAKASNDPWGSLRNDPSNKKSRAQ